MKTVFLKLALFASIVVLIANCTVTTQAPAPTQDRSPVIYKPANQYYYFTESQIERKKGNLDKAILLLRKAIELDPQSLYLKRELSTIYIQNKEAQKAVEVLEALLAKHPDDVKSLIMYGGIKQVQKKTDEAIKAYEKVINLDPNQEKVYAFLGRLYLDQGNSDKAEKIFLKMVENYPNSYSGHYLLGRIYARRNKMKLAEKEFQKALEIEPGRLDPRFELLELYKKQGKKTDTMGIYTDILKSQPNNIRASMELGYYYHQNGRKEEAERIFYQLGQRSTSEFEVIVKVIQIYIDQKKYDAALVVVTGLLKGAPDSPDLNHLAGITFYGLKDNDSAIRHFKAVTPQSRFYQDAVIHVAYLYQKNKEVKKAIEFLKSAIEKEPRNSEFRFYLGTYYEEINDFANSEKYLKEAIELESDNTSYYFRLGVVYDKWDKKEASMEVMRKVIALDPKHANALNYLGYTYADLGLNLDEAERLVKEALKYKPNDGYITDSLGWVYYKKGMFQEALKYLKKAVKLVPDDPIMLEHVGDTYLKLNDKENALKFYEQSLKRKEKDKEALKKKINELTGDGS
jgi:tetratricopeptide (TPR) repeat protein